MEGVVAAMNLPDRERVGLAVAGGRSNSSIVGRPAASAADASRSVISTPAATARIIRSKAIATRWLVVEGVIASLPPRRKCSQSSSDVAGGMVAAAIEILVIRLQAH